MSSMSSAIGACLVSCPTVVMAIARGAARKTSCLSAFLFVLVGIGPAVPVHAEDVLHQPNPIYVFHTILTIGGVHDVQTCPPAGTPGALPFNFFSMVNKPDPWTLQPFSSPEEAMGALKEHVIKCVAELLPACGPLRNIRVNSNFKDPSPTRPLSSSGWSNTAGGGSIVVDSPCRLNWSLGSAVGLAWYCKGKLGDCEQEMLTIKLLPAAGSPESDTVLASIEPASVGGTNITTLVARVYDQNGQFIPNVNVELTVDVIDRSGGHDHPNAGPPVRPKGQLSNGVTADITVSGNTGSGGLNFTFRAPEVAGDHAITAKCLDGKTCKQEGPNQVWVGVKGLMHIPPSSVYALITPNTDTFHPHNHFMNPLAMQRLSVLAALYQGKFPNDPVLHLNDASLERGGLFDINYSGRAAIGWWKPPHITHRKGTDIDIRANSASGAIPAANFREFVRIAARVGGVAKIHSPGSSNQHFHVSF